MGLDSQREGWGPLTSPVGDLTGSAAVANRTQALALRPWKQAEMVGLQTSFQVWFPCRHTVLFSPLLGGWNYVSILLRWWKYNIAIKQGSCEYAAAPLASPASPLLLARDVLAVLGGEQTVCSGWGRVCAGGTPAKPHLSFPGPWHASFPQLNLGWELPPRKVMDIESISMRRS